MDDSASVIDELLTEGVKDAVEGEERVGVIFSGGIDSTLVAKKASEFTETKCYTVGFPGSKDLEYARLAANALDLDCHETILDHETLEDALRDVARLVNEPNPLAVGVGVPMHLASKKAASEGIKVMLCGQGADELFGGYWRYIQSYVENGPDSVIDWMVRDVDTADADNLDRDRLVTSNNNIELRFPFLQNELVESSLNLPLEDRIREVKPDFKEYGCIDELDGRFFVRKYVLREVAENNGLPPEIINRSKKAAQYGSQVHKHMEKLARKKGFKKKARELGQKQYMKLYLESLIQ